MSEKILRDENSFLSIAQRSLKSKILRTDKDTIHG